MLTDGSSLFWLVAFGVFWGFGISCLQGADDAVFCVLQEMGGLLHIGFEFLFYDSWMFVTLFCKCRNNRLLSCGELLTC